MLKVFRVKTLQMCFIVFHVFSVPAPSLQLLAKKHIWSVRYQKYRCSGGLESKSLVPLLVRKQKPGPTFSQAFLVMLEDRKIK